MKAAGHSERMFKPMGQQSISLYCELLYLCLQMFYEWRNLYQYRVLLNERVVEIHFYCHPNLSSSSGPNMFFQVLSLRCTVFIFLR